jgi:hypothetical protein
MNEKRGRAALSGAALPGLIPIAKALAATAPLESNARRDIRELDGDDFISASLAGALQFGKCRKQGILTSKPHSHRYLSYSK